MNTLMKGKISGKNEEKKYGFITPEGMTDEKANNIFFHMSALEGVDFEDLRVGDVVEFDKQDSENGLFRAVGVKKA